MILCYRLTEAYNDSPKFLSMSKIKEFLLQLKRNDWTTSRYDINMKNLLEILKNCAFQPNFQALKSPSTLTSQDLDFNL